MAELRKRHGAHARALKNLDERYERFARAIELNAEARKGEWIERFCPDARELHLDLGCGKGQFAIAQAQLHPDVLFVGLDYDRRCIALAAQKACELELGNCVFALADAEDLDAFFAEGELARIYLNFSTPHPRKKHAAERLTYVDQLIAYRPLLEKLGSIDMKTDSPPFFEFSLIQFELAGYDVIWTSTDLRADQPDNPLTEYERRLCDKGAKVHACRAVKADRAYSREQTAELSLFPYLPEDLDTLSYIPYGMEGYVLNMRNKRIKDDAENI